MRKVAYAAVALIAALAFAITATAQQPPPSTPPTPEVAPPIELAITSALPEPNNLELIDVPNDGGTQFAALWNWAGAPAENISVALEVKSTTELLKKYELTEAQRNRLARAREQLKTELAPLLPDRDRLAAEAETAQQEQTRLENLPADERDYVAINAARRDYWRLQKQLEVVQHKVDIARDRFARASRYWSWQKFGFVDIAETAKMHDWLEAEVSANEFLHTSAEAPATELPTQADFKDVFGAKPSDPDKLFFVADSIVAPNPAPIAEVHDEYDETPETSIKIPLEAGRLYVARLALTDGTTINVHDLNPVAPEVNWLKVTVINSMLVGVIFALIILVAVTLARKNPNLFIRRIAGLEAVDEAIGRATEMGKPVLYLPGMDDLTTLATLAAINILGRVARKVAEYDSDLIVPNRDPVVMTVAQEVVRSAYMDVGRPDAFKEGNVYFVTADQFSYTATTCGIMLREKPAANFFMGYYYAESLLLAETGQSTGAIQIAGTDSQSQLPFFITTCDYTLIGEELYAASAYLSREPLLLGSLKGQDVAKAVMLLALLLQAALFIVNKDWDFIKQWFTPL